MNTKVNANIRTWTMWTTTFLQRPCDLKWSQTATRGITMFPIMQRVWQENSGVRLADIDCCTCSYSLTYYKRHEKKSHVTHCNYKPEQSECDEIWWKGNRYSDDDFQQDACEESYVSPNPINTEIDKKTFKGTSKFHHVIHVMLLRLIQINKIIPTKNKCQTPFNKDTISEYKVGRDVKHGC